MFPGVVMDSKDSAVEAAVAAGVPVFEVHYSNLLQRGLNTQVGKVATGQILGAKLQGYKLALMAARDACTEAWTVYDTPSV